MVPPPSGVVAAPPDAAAAAACSFFIFIKFLFFSSSIFFRASSLAFAAADFSPDGEAPVPGEGFFFLRVGFGLFDGVDGDMIDIESTLPP